MKRKWWVRWFAPCDQYGKFALYSPWWLTGTTADEPERDIFVAAIWADDQAEVEAILHGCYDSPQEPHQIEISFCEPLTFDPKQNPSGRFGWADWMTKYWERGEYRQQE